MPIKPLDESLAEKGFIFLQGADCVYVAKRVGTGYEFYEFSDGINLGTRKTSKNYQAMLKVIND